MLPYPADDIQSCGGGVPALENDPFLHPHEVFPMDLESLRNRAFDLVYLGMPDPVDVGIRIAELSSEKR